MVTLHDPCAEQPLRTHPRNGFNAKFVDAAPGTGNGWVEDVQMKVPLKSGDNIDEISSYWTVPANPTTNGGLIFIWNGIEPTAQNLVLQPVLQWGGTTAEKSVDGSIRSATA
jgi:hypothetical protein